MLFYLFLGFVGLLFLHLAQTYQKFRRNLKAAQQSGLPYVCLPWFGFNRIWLLTHRLFLPLLSRLPSLITEPWLKFLIPDWQWKYHMQIFRDLGDADMFILVSPARNLCFIANAEAIAQISTRRTDFPKPIDMYASLDIYGKNVVTTEGAAWRHQRKITSPPFTEKNNRLVWMESLYQANQMIRGYLKEENSESKTIWDLPSQAMRLSLHVISRAGFGVRLNWPHEGIDAGIPDGHDMSYKDAIEHLLENIIWVLLLPRSWLARSPFKSHQLAGQSYVEWGKYMREMYEAKRDEVQHGSPHDGLDLMNALVRGAGLSRDPNDATKNTSEHEKDGRQTLSEDEILGNAFVFILAGHETAANTINFAILYLAMHRDSQQRLQKDLDDILGDKPVEQWEYEEYVPRLFGGMCGAVLNEELRLIPPVIGIPKSTPLGRPGEIQANGHHYTIPGGAYIMITSNAVHRNPKYWPHSSLEDLDEFRPERWLLDTAQKSHGAEQPANQTEDGLDFDDTEKRADIAPSLFRPQRGAYVPFSEGYRSCIGRRFAQVEILAVLAVIFKQYSVELDVSMSMSDEELEKASADEKQRAWDKAYTRARDLLRDGMSTILTLQMRAGKVPLRFVRRGHERFQSG